MNNYQIKAGTTDVSVILRIIDAADGTPETGVVFNTAGMDLEYRREGAASVDITEVTLAALTTAHTDGGFLAVGNGFYRLDLPDAAVAAGSTGVLIHGTVTGMVVLGAYIQLVAYDPLDAVRLGLTALPNAAAAAAGGLITSGGVGNVLPTDAITAASVATDAVTEIQAAVAAGPVASVTGNVGGNVTGAVGSVTGNVAGNVVGAVGSVVGNVGGNVTGSVGSVAAGGVTAASFAAGAVNAAALATDAVTEIQAAVAAGAVASVTGAVGSVTGNVGGNVVGSVGSLGATAKAEVNAEVADVLTVDTIPELPQGQPPATPTIQEALALLYSVLRNENISSATEILFKDNSGTVVYKQALTLVPATSLTRAKMVAGP